ncbi:hypothetical protein D3C73_1179440 [compost metagenome]
MVQLDQVVDHAKAGHLFRRGRYDEQQQEEQRHGVALAAPGREQDDRGNGGVDPVAVRKKGHQCQREPQVAAALEIALGNQVHCRAACEKEHHASQEQNDDQRT